MTYQLNVYAIPTASEPEGLADATVVIIDVLRASTTIAHALQSGAREVIPCLEVDEARQLAQRMPPGEVLLGGERYGLPIPGFDLGNSPAEYTPQRVAGKTIVFTTTNGTRAMACARRARRAYIGAFVNATAIAERLFGQQRISLLCSGTRGEIGADDLLLAGMLVQRLAARCESEYRQNAQATAAAAAWLHHFSLPQALGVEALPAPQLADQLRQSQGGKNLLAIGQEDDILAAAEVDRFCSVPELDPEAFRIRLA